MIIVGKHRGEYGPSWPCTTGCLPHEPFRSHPKRDSLPQRKWWAASRWFPKKDEQEALRIRIPGELPGDASFYPTNPADRKTKDTRAPATTFFHFF